MGSANDCPEIRRVIVGSLGEDGRVCDRPQWLVKLSGLNLSDSAEAMNHFSLQLCNLSPTSHPITLPQCVSGVCELAAGHGPSRLVHVASSLLRWGTCELMIAAMLENGTFAWLGLLKERGCNSVTTIRLESVSEKHARWKLVWTGKRNSQEIHLFH